MKIISKKDYEMILSSNNISQELKNYLKEKADKKELWVKAYLKIKFCAGMSTTSRIESKHRVLKKFLNSSKRLVELYQTFNQLEDQEIRNFSDKISRFGKKKNESLGKYELIKEIKKKYSPYCLNIVKNNLLEGLNYLVVKIKEGTW